MAKYVFEFDMVDAQGGPLGKVLKRCHRAWAPSCANEILTDHPDAVAVFASERRGPAICAAYRGD